MRIRTLTISELNRYISSFIKADPISQSVRVEGEVSNLKFHSGGNIYFTLKDNNSKINCIIFCDTYITEELSEGDRIICQGKINLYERDASVSIIVSKTEKTGIGELYKRFLELKSKLEKEGMFDQKHKKQIPYIPSKIGVITSSTGSVIRDIYNVINNRFPKVEILLYPALVQGDRAYEDVISGIKYFNSATKKEVTDVIIIARGGGSFEELSTFNNENLAYEIFNSKIPIVSAIGHENDFTIADFVSDLRASTPSMAGELTVPSMLTLKKDLDNMNNQLNREASRIFESNYEKLCNIKNTIEIYNPLVTLTRKKEEIDKLKYELQNQLYRILETNNIILNSRKEQLVSLNPLNLLDRGYTTVSKQNQELITRSTQLKKNDVINIQFYDGLVTAKVIGGNNEK